MTEREQALLDSWCERAQGPGYVIVTDSDLSGRPWDTPDYIEGVRRARGELLLHVRGGSGALRGRVTGISGLRLGPHPWGSVLWIQGPLRWQGERQRAARGLLTEALSALTSKPAPTERTPFSYSWPQMGLVLPK